MHDCVLSEKDDFAWGRDEDIVRDTGWRGFVAFETLCALESPLLRISLVQLLERDRRRFVAGNLGRDGTGRYECVLEVIKQVPRVLDTDT